MAKLIDVTHEISDEAFEKYKSEMVEYERLIQKTILNSKYIVKSLKAERFTISDHIKFVYRIKRLKHSNTEGRSLMGLRQLFQK